ncbi:MAG: hypothetical protein ACT4PU_13635 [Planctomycetota bacterium]
MKRADAIFLGGAAALTVLVPGLLVLTNPFAEAGATLGAGIGWGLALVGMLMGWALMARSRSRPEPAAFVRAFMAGMVLRLFLTIAVMVGFVTLVADPALKTFLLAYFLGFSALTGLELLSMKALSGTGRKPRPEASA